MRKCRYCDFFSVPFNDEALAGKVLTATIGQVGYFFDVLQNPAVRTLYIGGGTPSIMPLGLLESFLSDLERRVTYRGQAEEATVEVNPETVTRDLLAVLSDLGITRISMGVQSFHDELLKTLGRKVAAAGVEKALDMIAATWKGELSVDLITGIPGQTAAQALSDIERMIKRGPGHVSLYTLSIEHGTELESDILSGKVRLLDEDVQAELWLQGVQRLKDAGYLQYEINQAGNACTTWHTGK